MHRISGCVFRPIKGEWFSPVTLPIDVIRAEQERSLRSIDGPFPRLTVGNILGERERAVLDVFSAVCDNGFPCVLYLVLVYVHKMRSAIVEIYGIDEIPHARELVRLRPKIVEAVRRAIKKRLKNKSLLMQDSAIEAFRCGNYAVYI
jgi:hypothetical protein